MLTISSSIFKAELSATKFKLFLYLLLQVLKQVNSLTEMLMKAANIK